MAWVDCSSHFLHIPSYPIQNTPGTYYCFNVTVIIGGNGPHKFYGHALIYLINGTIPYLVLTETLPVYLMQKLCGLCGTFD